VRRWRAASADGRSRWTGWRRARRVRRAPRVHRCQRCSWNEQRRAGDGAPGGRALLVVDIGVPRNIDPGAGEVFGVDLLDIDDLRALGRAVARAAASGDRQSARPHRRGTRPSPLERSAREVLRSSLRCVPAPRSSEPSRWSAIGRSWLHSTQPRARRSTRSRKAS
jgi:hypothetical protein